MKEFDLEAAKKGAPVCTRDGSPVRIVCWDAKNSFGYKLIALITDKKNGMECQQVYNEKGKKPLSSEYDAFDLMMVEEDTRKEGWVVVAKNDKDEYVNSMLYLEEEKVKEAFERWRKRCNYDPEEEYYPVAISKIEWQEEEEE